MEKNAAIEVANFELKKAGLPTYTELQAALNELAAYRTHDVCVEAVKASAERARALANPA